MDDDQYRIGDCPQCGANTTGDTGPELIARPNRPAAHFGDVKWYVAVKCAACGHTGPSEKLIPSDYLDMVAFVAAEKWNDEAKK